MKEGNIERYADYFAFSAGQCQNFCNGIANENYVLKNAILYNDFYYLCAQQRFVLAKSSSQLDFPYRNHKNDLTTFQVKSAFGYAFGYSL